MKFEVPIKVDIDDVTKLIHDLQCLQTYKLWANDDTVLVSLDSVVGVFADHIRAKRLDKDTNVPTKWIPVSERMPKEKDAGILKKIGINKKSDYVIATVKVKGERMTVTACTYDGAWDWNMKYAFPDYEIIAWMPLPEPWKGET